jgi:hypothetical protein
MRSINSGSSMLAITLKRPAAAHAQLDLNPEHALQAPRPSQPNSFRRWLLRRRSALARTRPSSRRRDRRAQRRVRCEHAVKSRQVHRGGGASAASRATKSSGSSTMCVVPFRYGVFKR